MADSHSARSLERELAPSRFERKRARGTRATIAVLSAGGDVSAVEALGGRPADVRGSAVEATTGLAVARSAVIVLDLVSPVPDLHPNVFRRLRDQLPGAALIVFLPPTCQAMRTLSTLLPGRVSALVVAGADDLAAIAAAVTGSGLPPSAMRWLRTLLLLAFDDKPRDLLGVYYRPPLPTSASAAARLLGCSLRTLSRLHSRAGLAAPRDILLSVRVLVAIRLLQTTTLTRQEIASATGFTSVRDLRRVLRQRCGAPPNVVRTSADGTEAILRLLDGMRASHDTPCCVAWRADDRARSRSRTNDARPSGDRHTEVAGGTPGLPDAAP